ncbi:RNA polymerase sigma-54 factor, partial [Nonlabens mediterrranea]|nr:RNA polymerase sigma-54 factor [Nonlabens mediterrranea]
MLRQSLNFKLSQKLSPQQIQLMKLIQLPTQAFEQRVKQELEENPALDDGKDSLDDDFDEFSNQDEYGDENDTMEAEINVDEYLSDDDIPEYRTQANNYSADDDEKSIPYASGTSFTQSLIEQLNTRRL